MSKPHGTVRLVAIQQFHKHYNLNMRLYATTLIKTSDLNKTRRYIKNTEFNFLKGGVIVNI